MILGSTVPIKPKSRNAKRPSSVSSMFPLAWDCSRDVDSVILMRGATNCLQSEHSMRISVHKAGENQGGDAGLHRHVHHANFFFLTFDVLELAAVDPLQRQNSGSPLRPCQLGHPLWSCDKGQELVLLQKDLCISGLVVIIQFLEQPRSVGLASGASSASGAAQVPEPINVNLCLASYFEDTLRNFVCNLHNAHTLNIDGAMATCRACCPRTTALCDCNLSTRLGILVALTAPIDIHDHEPQGPASPVESHLAPKLCVTRHAVVLTAFFAPRPDASCRASGPGLREGQPSCACCVAGNNKTEMSGAHSTTKPALSNQSVSRDQDTMQRHHKKRT